MLQRRKIISQTYFLAAALSLVSCGASPPEPPPLAELTQLQVRQLQTREYEDLEEKTLVKSLIGALLDQGFIISTINPDYGLVTAAMELREEDKATKGWLQFWYGPGMGTYQTTKRFEASANVQKEGKFVRVRINIVAKALTNAGGVIWSQPVYDAKVYQDIFSKIDKAVFLQREKL